jgi:hypothetical protein
MPQLVRAGYSWWNPGTGQTTEKEFGPLKYRKHSGCPRLFRSRKTAILAIAQWNCNPNSRLRSQTSYYGEDDTWVDGKPDGRKKEDLAVVEVMLHYDLSNCK